MLKKIDWDENIMTGVPAIDVQHKELIRAFNDFADALEKNQGATAVKKLLIYLKFYAEWHFEREEKCADEYNCPIAQTNKQAHQKFFEIFNELHLKYRQSEDPEEIAYQVHEKLTEWIVNHVMKVDKQIGVCVHGSNA